VRGGGRRGLPPGGRTDLRLAVRAGDAAAEVMAETRVRGGARMPHRVRSRRSPDRDRTTPDTPRPHILGVDDAPFDKGQAKPVAIVGVVMEGPDRIESIALGEFTVDGEGATDYLAGWIGGRRARPAL